MHLTNDYSIFKLSEILPRSPNEYNRDTLLLTSNEHQTKNAHPIQQSAYKGKESIRIKA